MLRVLLLIGLLLLPSGAFAGDVACQYDCLAHGGLQEVCNSKCGFRGPEEKYNPDGSFNPEAGKVKKYYKYEPTEEEKAAEAKAAAEAEEEDVDPEDVDLEALAEKAFYRCVSRCRNAGNARDYCRDLCDRQE